MGQEPADEADADYAATRDAMDAAIAKRAQKAAAKRAADGSAAVEAKEAKELAKRVMKGAKAKAAEEAAADEAEESDEDEDSEAEGEAEQEDSDSEAELVHESLKTPAERRKRDAKKYVPEDESRADRDRRTIFIGNVPIECVKEKVSPPNPHPQPSHPS